MKLLAAGPEAVDQFWAAHARSELIGLQTSGTTTGTPRVVTRTTNSWVDSFDAVASGVGLGPTDRLWIPGPLSSTMNLFAACLAGHVGASWSPDATDCTHAQLTPARLSQLVVDRCQDDQRSAQVHTVIVAGDGLSRSLRDRASTMALRTCHYYGAAEMSLVAIGSCSDDLELFDSVEARVDDGDLWVRSPWLSRGYASDDLIGSLRWADDGYCTVGDQARLDGSHLVIAGRQGHVTSAGQTINVADVAAQLATRATGDIYLVGVPDESLGQILTCVVTDAADIAPLRAWARSHLEGAHRPRLWTHVADVPLTTAAKVDHTALTALAAHQLGRQA